MVRTLFLEHWTWARGLSRTKYTFSHSTLFLTLLHRARTGRHHMSRTQTAYPAFTPNRKVWNRCFRSLDGGSRWPLPVGGAAGFLRFQADSRVTFRHRACRKEPSQRHLVPSPQATKDHVR